MKEGKREGKYIGEISALCFLPSDDDDDSLSLLRRLPYLLAGSGSEVMLYNMEEDETELLNSFSVFRGGIRVHGIHSTSSSSKKKKIEDDDGGCDVVGVVVNECWRIAVYGERKVKLFNLTIITTTTQQHQHQQSSSSSSLVLMHSLPKFTHWVLDLLFFSSSSSSEEEEEEEEYALAVGCSDNSLHFWNNNYNSHPITKLISPGGHTFSLSSLHHGHHCGIFA